MAAFVISPLPAVLSESLQTGEPFAPSALPDFFATADPSANHSPVLDFPVSPVTWFLAPPVSRRGEEGFSSCLPDDSLTILKTALSIGSRDSFPSSRLSKLQGF
jgi:hypothetical protein